MARVVVEVMPKPEILDPQGKAVAEVLARLGIDDVTGVRQGKRFEVHLAGEATEENLTQIRQAAEEVLANSLLEDVVSVHVAGLD
ncbi:MAG TPA: phosphoribosylformylglycinamidine synthase subunit PurS [Beutenbergiaceae bacterium]|nr:phosphoribosylformylglycinamidine synthase subunit PurS [Beutenbergiaceae bacterium]